jgi:hypothetical protein
MLHVQQSLPCLRLWQSCSSGSFTVVHPMPACFNFLLLLCWLRAELHSLLCLVWQQQPSGQAEAAAGRAVLQHGGS